MDNPWKGTLTADFSVFYQLHPVLPSFQLWWSNLKKMIVSAGQLASVTQAAAMEMYNPGLGAFWSHCLSNSSSHLVLPMPPQKRLMPAQGFISHQVNRSGWSNLPQPFYVHFPKGKGSYHLFLSWMLYSQEQIRFSQNMLLIGPGKQSQGSLGDFDKLCPTVVMENWDTASPLSCGLHKDTLWDASKRRISIIFTLGLSYLVGPSCQWHNFVCSKADLTLTNTPSLLSARFEQARCKLEQSTSEKTYSWNKVRRRKIILIVETVCTLRHSVIWVKIINLMTQDLTSEDTCNADIFW